MSRSATEVIETIQLIADVLVVNRLSACILSRSTQTPSYKAAFLGRSGLSQLQACNELEKGDA